MAEAFGEDDRKSYKYQYSILPAIHAYDTDAYFGPRPDTMSVAFQTAVKCEYLKFSENTIHGLLTSISDLEQFHRHWRPY